MTPLNPMAFYTGFPHIAEQIFVQMNKNDLRNFRKVSKSCQNCIDNKNILWNKIVKDQDSIVNRVC